MKMNSREYNPLLVFLVAIILLFAFSTDTRAQQKEKKDKITGKEGVAAAEVAQNMVQQAIQQEAIDQELIEEKNESESEGDYVYRPKGRRDPFWDLLKGKDAKLRREAREGIAGLEIEQLELEGIALKNGTYIALFKGPDSKPYDVKVGQSVYDGEIIKIDSESVVFKKILTIALGGTKEKTIVIRLNPEDEVKNEN